MSSIDPISVCSTTKSSDVLDRAFDLARMLNVSFTPSFKQSNSDILLVYTQDGLKLQDISKNVEKPQTLLFVDFLGGKNGYRFAQDKTTKQPLAKAAGLKPGFRPSIFDATAGLGADGFVLATLGCRVTLCERSLLMYALLQDGLERAAQSPFTKDIILEQIQLISENSIDYLKNTKNRYQCIYLDPMYPHSTQSALNKLSMRTIRTYVGDDQDSEQLLEVSLRKAANRVVVKRPKLAPCISELKPSHEIKMKNSRFDVYLTFND